MKAGLTILLVSFISGIATLRGQDKAFVYWENLPGEQKNGVLSSSATLKDAIHYYNGKFKPSDDERTFRFLDSLTRSNNYMRGNETAFYFFVFNDIFMKSDGALAEVMGGYCLQVIVNAPGYVISYLADKENLRKLYAMRLGYEFYFKEKGTSDLKYSFKEFKTLLSSKLSRDKKYDRFLNLFYTEIQGAMQGMD